MKKKTFEELDELLLQADQLDYEAAMLAAYGASRLADLKWDRAAELRREVWTAMAELC